MNMAKLKQQGRPVQWDNAGIIINMNDKNEGNFVLVDLQVGNTVEQFEKVDCKTGEKRQPLLF